MMGRGYYHGATSLWGPSGGPAGFAAGGLAETSTVQEGILLVFLG